MVVQNGNLTQSRSVTPRRSQHPTISRPRLTDQLNAGLAATVVDGRLIFGGRLTLVCGPAGFGKTTLIRDWLSQLPFADTQPTPRIAWRSLESFDDDPGRFTTAMNRTLGAAIPEWLEWRVDSQPEHPAALANAILEFAADQPLPVLLVLDDYHAIGDPAIHSALADLLDDLPASWHVTIVTREDPPIPLGRMRAHRELVELRARDLRFSREEAAAFLNDLMQCDLQPQEIELLETRTEGWIAGLQLAAHSLRNQSDRAAFIAAFAGDDRYVADYLLEEVLLNQSSDMQRFLQQTAILNRLHPELCNAVTLREDSQDLLWHLEQANLFVLPLDNKRSWYRYHGLFADLLLHRLQKSNEDIAALHDRASRWYERQGMPDPAIDHALAAGAIERAADLITELAPHHFQTNQLIALTRWLSRLPNDLFVKRTRLALAGAWAFLATGDPDRATDLITAVQTGLGHTTTALCNTAHADLPPDLALALVETAAIQARLAIDSMDLTRVQELCQCTLPHLEALREKEWSADDEPRHFISAASPAHYNSAEAIHPVILFDHGLALKFANETAEASRVLSAAADLSSVAGNQHLVALSLGHLAHIERLHGRLDLANQTCERGLELVTNPSGSPTPMAGLLVANQGNVAYERNDLAEAEATWRRALEMARPWQSWETDMPARLGLARLWRSHGDHMAGVTELDRLEQLTHDKTNVLTPIVAAYRAWFLAEAGETNAALHWAEEAAAEERTVVPFIAELQKLARARILLAADRPGDAVPDLLAVIDDSTSGGRHLRLIDALVLMAVVCLRQNDSQAALRHFDRAVDLAQSERIVRPFLDAGSDMVHLLGLAMDSGHGGLFARRLSATLHDETIAQEGSLPTEINNQLGLVEPLSDRELEVLQLIEAGLTNREIGERLFLTEGTVKNHAHSLYGKLQVNGRTKAVAKARALGLIGHG